MKILALIVPLTTAFSPPLVLRKQAFPFHCRSQHLTRGQSKNLTPLHLWIETSAEPHSVAVAVQDVLSLVVTTMTTAAKSSSLVENPTLIVAAEKVLEGSGVSYSPASYYTILALYIVSFPGLWSTIKRSTSAKIKRKTYVVPGENAAGGKSLRQQAGEIMAYMKANNYEVVEAGSTITFRGVLQRSLSQALFLVFCTALGLLSLGLVLDIQFHDFVLPVIGKPNWFLLTLLSPYAGIYYWQSGDRVDDCSVQLSTNQESTENEILVQGSEEELERMWRTLEWKEKGMVKISGVMEKLA